jgi:hypothetical protein
VRARCTFSQLCSQRDLAIRLGELELSLRPVATLEPHSCHQPVTQSCSLVSFRLSDRFFVAFDTRVFPHWSHQIEISANRKS